MSRFFQSFISDTFYVDMLAIILLLLNIYGTFYLSCLFAALSDLVYISFFTPKIPFYLILLLFILIFNRFFVLKNNVIKIAYMVAVYLPVSVFLCYLYNSLNITYTLVIFFTTTCMSIMVSFLVEFALFVYKRLNRFLLLSVD